MKEIRVIERPNYKILRAARTVQCVKLIINGVAFYFIAVCCRCDEL
jgi:hypothetical protein